MTKARWPHLGALCVFCGSSVGGDPRHREQAARLGRQLAETGTTLVYGGGHVGMMGVIAEAALTAGGRVVGIIPEHLLRIEAPYREISELIVVDSMHTRKRKMFDLADAFCVLPGGLGTLDETFEILTWKQLRLHNKPIVVANLEGYWTPWVTLVEGIISQGFARPATAELYSVVDKVEDILPTVESQISAAVSGESQLF